MYDIVFSPMPLEDFKLFIRDCVYEGLKFDDMKIIQKPLDEDGFLTTKEAAQFLKVTVVSIHNWKREKGLKFHRLGRSVRFKKSDLIAFAENRRKVDRRK